MPKIRDLGISFIPATMRPPEIGAGGGYHMGGHTPPQCAGTPPDNPCQQNICTLTDDDDDCINCTMTDKDDCRGNSGKHDNKREVAGFGHQAVAQLKQQLREEMGRGLEY